MWFTDLPCPFDFRVKEPGRILNQNTITVSVTEADRNKVIWLLPNKKRNTSIVHSSTLLL